MKNTEKTVQEYAQIGKIRAQGADWVRAGNYWLFGTLTYKAGVDISDSTARRNARRYFNALDRQLLGRGAVDKGKRLPRLVFLEHGRSRTNTHLHFFIKGYELRHLRQIQASAQARWKGIDYAHDVTVRDLLGTDTDRSGYCFKEWDRADSEVLLLECCHTDNA